MTELELEKVIQQIRHSAKFVITYTTKEDLENELGRTITDDEMYEMQYDADQMSLCELFLESLKK